jgi:hypothetical protein
MEINGTKYGFTIAPNYDKVVAEIYRVVDIAKSEMHIRILSKEFGSMFRTPNENDYKKAREWADLQMKCIMNANS